MDFFIVDGEQLNIFDNRATILYLFLPGRRLSKCRSERTEKLQREV